MHKQTETPYSRYGIGELLNSGFARQSAMADWEQPFRSSSAVNFSNPASYSSIRISTFETALRGELAQTSTSDLKQTKRHFTQLSFFRFSGDERQLGVPVLG